MAHFKMVKKIFTIKKRTPQCGYEFIPFSEGKKCIHLLSYFITWLFAGLPQNLRKKLNLREVSRSHFAFSRSNGWSPLEHRAKVPMFSHPYGHCRW